MNPNKKRLAAGAIGTLIVLLLVARVTIRHHVYAPGAWELQQYLANPVHFDVPFFSTFTFGSFVWLAVRKLYGIATFTLVSFFLSATFARPVRFRNTVIIITILRACLEVAERLMHRGDSIFESVFDTMTGTLAAALGAVAYSLIAKRSEGA